MNDFDASFPFPGKEAALAELKRDPCYEKIPEADREKIALAAWEKGRAAAGAVFREQAGETDFFVIARANGLEVRRVEKDFVLGGMRYFCDYISGKNLINLYTLSVALWAEKNNLSQEAAENFILGHEFYHFLEWTKIGLTSKDYLVPMLDIGFLKIGKTGIRALSEIGAHGFAYEYFVLSKGEKYGKDIEV